MKVKIKSEVAESCPTLRDAMDCSPPGSSILEIFQARVLEWVAIAFSVKMYIHIQKSVSSERLWNMGLVALLGALPAISGLGSTEQGSVH